VFFVSLTQDVSLQSAKLGVGIPQSKCVGGILQSTGPEVSSSISAGISCINLIGSIFAIPLKYSAI
jgi:hypothetical protein